MGNGKCVRHVKLITATGDLFRGRNLLSTKVGIMEFTDKRIFWAEICCFGFYRNERICLDSKLAVMEFCSLEF